MKRVETTAASDGTAIVERASTGTQAAPTEPSPSGSAPAAPAPTERTSKRSWLTWFGRRLRVDATGTPRRAKSVETSATNASSLADTSESSARNALEVRGLRKSFGGKRAVAGIDFSVRRGTFTGIVGPNGAGKTTTLSMMSGLLRPDAGSIVLDEIDVWQHPDRAKRRLGVLPDRLRLFEALTGAQMLYYSGMLRGVPSDVVRERTSQLAHAFGISEAIHRPVSDYSVGMAKKVALAASLIHTPRTLILDEPFESMDPVSAAAVIEVLKTFVAGGGTVVMSSHSMDVIDRTCDDVLIVVDGELLASGSVESVRAGGSLEDTFLELVGGAHSTEGLEWLHTFSE